MTDYVVMFPADSEAEWDAGTEADHQATFDTDAEFAKAAPGAGWHRDRWRRTHPQQ